MVCVKEAQWDIINLQGIEEKRRSGVKNTLEKLRERLPDGLISEALDFVNGFKHIAPYDLIDILKHVDDMGMLKPKGEEFIKTMDTIFEGES